VQRHRHALNVRPVYKRVDTCAAEFASATAYMYSTYEEECEALPSDRNKIMVLGGGPNRIGQGIEFDYCCVHAALAMREDGYETIMVNCNPETVSTDYDTSDRLFFEPVTFEDVLEIVRAGAAARRDRAVWRPDAAESLPRAWKRPACRSSAPARCDRPRRRPRAFPAMMDALGLKQPAERHRAQRRRKHRWLPSITYPLVVRPSYVLGGRAMEIVYNEEELRRYMRTSVKVVQ
jgi:carbamoyl-phosphate synthase large subunit